MSLMRRGIKKKNFWGQGGGKGGFWEEDSVFPIGLKKKLCKRA